MRTRSESAHIRRQFAIGFACSLGYFVVLLWFPAAVSMNPFLWVIVVCFAAGAILAALALGIPLALAGYLVTRHWPSVWVGILTYLLVGGATAYLTFGFYALGTLGSFQPLSAFGPGSGDGVLLISAFAGLCTMAGWLTARRNATPPVYDDALGGLDFAALAELIRRAQQEKA